MVTERNRCAGRVTRAGETRQASSRSGVYVLCAPTYRLEASYGGFLEVFDAATDDEGCTRGRAMAKAHGVDYRPPPPDARSAAL
jgi:hypothetical protein